MTASARASSEGGTGEAEHLGYLEVDHQIELCRLLNREIRRLGAFDDFPGVDADLTPKGRDIGSIAESGRRR